AAALNRSRLRRHGNVPNALRALWEEAGVPPVPGIDEIRWAGTPPLTRAVSRPVADGLFLIGDAAAYEEPFTGEGMTWAIASAVAVAPLAAEAAREWHPALAHRWAVRHRRLLGWRRWRCRLLAQLVRSPGMVGVTARLLQSMPGLGSSLAASLTGSPRVPEAGP
ncbi:MAG TPA: NAD-binding protein, partial [Acidobacteria bacterium]|nr:NAD-binding protein [Acidobacteriota bacterium]